MGSEYTIKQEGKNRYVVMKAVKESAKDLFPLAICKTEKQAEKFIAKQSQISMGVNIF